MVTAIQYHHSIRFQRFSCVYLLAIVRLACSVLLFATICSAATLTLVPEQASSSDAFVDSMGVVVQLENVGTLYQTHLTDYIEPALIASGLRHVRDGGLASTLNDYGMTQIYVDTYNQVASLVQQHTGHRLGFDLILAPLNGGSSNGSNSCDWLTRSPVSTLLKYLNIEYVDGFEGMNEYDWE